AATAETSCGAPPLMLMRSMARSPIVKKAIERPSGENAGSVTSKPSVPGITFASRSDIARLNNPCGAPEYTISEPSGDTATMCAPRLPFNVCPAGRAGAKRVGRGAGDVLGAQAGGPPGQA